MLRTGTGVSHIQKVAAMPPIPCVDLLKHAQENGYALGYFEAWNLESLCAIVRAAEIARSPVMIGFCGEYLDNPQRRFKEDLNLYATIAKKVAQNASVPVATLLNETVDIDLVYQGVKAGFDMVMFVDEAMPVDELTEINKKLAEFAHARGVAVEAEVGTLGLADRSANGFRTGHKTDPEVAARFVEETGVDALAISIGNVHFLEGGKASLDLDLLEQLHQKIPIPLVLHGGTGVDKADFKLTIARGIAKVNVGSRLKRVVIEAERRYFAENNVDSMNPNDILGKGGPLDINVHSQTALIEEVLGFIQVFGGQNRASCENNKTS